MRANMLRHQSTGRSSKKRISFFAFLVCQSVVNLAGSSACSTSSCEAASRHGKVSKLCQGLDLKYIIL